MINDVVMMASVQTAAYPFSYAATLQLSSSQPWRLLHLLPVARGAPALLPSMSKAHESLPFFGVCWADS